SPTGTGKTLANMQPLLKTEEKGQGNQLLINVPSQEIAMQIAEDARTWAKPLILTVQTLFGGAYVYRQIDLFKKRPEV
ncbi:DEAD/DEAH box helicase, partial [Enterococcus faecalis]|uniref:DEAD/DEAH box helicase n=1 Tax=Enterococcus faecalis TaxID=1351 RepID=UPI00403F7AB8